MVRLLYISTHTLSDSYYYSGRTDALPPMKEQLNGVKIKTPIEQQIHGTGGHFRQENMEKRKYMSVREWVEHCAKDEYRAPGVSEVGLRSGGKIRTTKTRRSRSETGDALDDAGTPQYNAQTDAKKRQSREANQAAKNKRDAEFLETFQPHIDWLPPGTIPEDYTPKFCEDLARQFWRNCGIGKPPWYGADSQGSIRLLSLGLANNIQVPCSRMRRNHGMWLTSIRPCPDCYLRQTKVFQASTPLTSIGECGGRHSPGTSKTWIFSVSTTSTLALRNSGMPFRKVGHPHSSKA